MKKIAIYASCLLAALISSCSDDYTDWAAPQGFDEEEARNINVTISSVSAIEMENVATETVQLFSASVDAPEGMEITAYEAVLAKAGESGAAQEKITLPANASGTVSTQEVVGAVENFYGKNPVARKLALTVLVYLKQENEAFCVASNQVEAEVTLVTPDISSAYYLVGDMYGWNEASMVKFNHSDVNIYDDPVFTISFTTTADNQCWKIIPQKNIDTGDFWANPGVVGVRTDGDDSMSGSLVNDGAGAGKIAKAGKYNMTINMMDYTYEITEAPTELYMTGTAFENWNTWHQLTPVNSHEGNYWTIIYCNAGDEFKFSPTEGWEGAEFGSSAPMNDMAGAGLEDAGGNVKVSNAGWYLIHVLNGETRAINVYTPNVYLIGETIGGWDISEANKFEIPATAEGEFVSPAFAQNAELRMCVSIEGFEWWQTEFIILDGKIDYRGNGPDQTRVSVTEGQKAYLNFATDTGEIK